MDNAAPERSIRFSIIMFIQQAHPVFFRDCLAAIANSVYRNFELIIVDASGTGSNGSVAEEFFPESGRLGYYRIRPGRSRGYGLNLAINYARGDYLVFMDSNSRMRKKTLASLAGKALETDADLIYSDTDELLGTDRVHPDLKSGPNTELIRHRNYIGEMFSVKTEAVYKIGTFRDALNHAVYYDFLLRTFEKRLTMAHISQLLFSKRIFHEEKSGKEKAAKEAKSDKEHIVVCKAHLERSGISAKVTPSKRSGIWKVDYDGSGYKSHRKEYLLVREGGVRVSFKEAVYRMYGHMRQPDVGIVGGAWLRRSFAYENCGYIFSDSGICYPACHGQSVFSDGYKYRCIVPQDVSAVDLGFCMINKKLFRHLRGFDTALADRDMMLDFCLRVRRAGYRIVFDPNIRAMRRKTTHESNAVSNERLMEKLGDMIERGDPYYNENLPMGLENYFLY